ncbi:MAG: GNAT family N-acetyltransferase [Chloroflexi bacterium]|nr:MAG: GNAT family N-acetyltransferase [Chloroflexota bacterium]
MSIRVRLFAERDYLAFVRIKSLADGARLSVDDVRAEDGRWDHSRYEKVRIVSVDEEDAPIGYGEIYHEPSRFERRRYFLRLGVDGALRRRGIGAAIWQQLRAELDERSALVACLWVGDRTACHSFIEARGFVEVIRAYEQVVALATARIPLRAAEEKIAGTGIEIKTVAELRRDRGETVLHDVQDLRTAARIDQPTLGPVTSGPFEEWLAYNIDGPQALPDAYFVALEGDRCVGCSSAVRMSDDQLRIGITAVLPAYRRRGIARLLKLRVHDWARRNSYREIHTSTTRPNVGMLALNESLGYVIVDSWGGYELRMSS